MKKFLVSCPALGAQSTEVEAASADKAGEKFRGLIKGLNGDVKLVVIDPDGKKTETSPSLVVSSDMLGGETADIVQKANDFAEQAGKEADKAREAAEAAQKERDDALAELAELRKQKAEDDENKDDKKEGNDGSLI